MANKNLYTGKYPVVELTGINNLGTEDIKGVTKASGVTVLMNGMGVVVDEVKGEASLPATIKDYVWLHASVEKLYNNEGRNEFAITDTTKGFLARVYRFRKGQTFETNAVVYDDVTYATISAISEAVATGLYLIPSTDGLWTLTATIPSADPIPVVYAKVKGVVVLPNGETGLEAVVVADGR